MRLFGSLCCWSPVPQERSVFRKISPNTTGYTQNCVSPVKEIPRILYWVEEFNLSPQSQSGLLHQQGRRGVLYSLADPLATHGVLVEMYRNVLDPQRHRVH